MTEATKKETSETKASDAAGTETTETTAPAAVPSAAAAAGTPAPPPTSAAASSGCQPRRTERTTVSLPIAYGSVAFYLGKKSDDAVNTHSWTLYLRGPNNEDLSAVISKVVFHLHPSFAEPTRELREPPYEVTERGWGEFEAQIRIIWKDPNEKPTLVSHGIKLYPAGAPPNAVPTNTETPVVAETYDEVVFTDPIESFYIQLLRIQNLDPILSYSQQAHFSAYTDAEQVALLLEAEKFLQQELSTAKERLLAVDRDLQEVDEALRDVQDAKNRKSVSRRSRNGGPPTKKTRN